MGPRSDPYRRDNVHGSPPRVSGNEYRRTSGSHPALQPPVRGGDSSLVNRSFSSIQSPAFDQAQPFDTYGARKNGESSLQYVPSTHIPQYIASFQDQRHRSVEPAEYAVESFMPNVAGYNAHSSPLTGRLCRYPSCTRPVTRDAETQEFNEYCSQSHMERDLWRGVPRCPVCNTRPCRINGNFCGSCERRDTRRHPQPQQHQQYYSLSGLSARSPVPSSGNATWSTATGKWETIGSHDANNQYLFRGSPPVAGQVRCPRCSMAYPPRSTSRSQSRYETDISLPPCPHCGYSRIA